MLAAAAVFIYFDEPLYIRIISGVIFVTGAVLLYQLLSSSIAAGEDEQGGDTDETATPPKREPTRRDSSARETGTREASPRADETAPGTQEAHAELPALDAFVPDDAIPPELYRLPDDGLPTDDPRAEFDFLTNRLLQVLKEHVLANTVGLFWINMDREQIIIGEFVTESRNFTTARRMSIGADLLSRIALSGKPEIVAEISSASEGDVAIYYDAAEGIRSIVGVPLFFGDELIAVLMADSKAPDAFGLESVAAIGRVSSLIALLLNSYNQKYDLAADARMLGVLDRLRKSLGTTQDSHGIASAAAQAVTEIMDWDYVAVILHHPDRQVWAVVRSMSKAANLPYINEGVTVGLEHSVLRAALEHSEGVIVPAPTNPEYRFHEKEVINSSGQICAIPMASASAWYGLLVVEYRENHQYAAQDLRILQRIASATTAALEIARLREVTRNHLLIDESTQVASRTLLLQRLKEEQERVTAVGGSNVLFIVALDNPDDLVQRHGKNELETALRRIGEALREHLRPFDLVGRFDTSSFGVLLLHSSPEDAYLRGEKIRKHIAGSVQSRGNVTYSLSVSIAGCTISQGTDTEGLLRLARQALDRAVSDGGNCVKVV